MAQIAAIVLAAGASTRFGQPKQLVDWHGTPLVAHIASVAHRAGLAPVVVVLGSHAERVGTAIRSAALPVQTVMNWSWQQGLSTSVATGLMALRPDTDAIVFLQCDQPLITIELLRALAARFQETGAAIVYPVVGDQRYSPVLFGRELFAELTQLTGDVGGRALISRHSDQVATVAVANPDVVADMDAPADYERLSKRAQSTQLAGQRALEAGGAEDVPATRVASVMSAIRHLVIDMDGVLWQGDEALPGLVELFEFLREHELGFILATNNSSRLPEQYAAKLEGFGVKVSPEHVLTSAQATAAYLKTVAQAGARVYPVGGDGLHHALQAEGFTLTDEHADYVVVGWDRQLTWNKMATAALLIHYGAGFIGTNPDTNYPTEKGPVPGNGAQLAMLETTTGVPPIVVGKPEPWMYREALRRMGADPETTAVIGDRLETDVAGGVPLRLTTILVLSGIATAADVAGSPIKPDLVLTGIDELVRKWRGNT